MKHGDARKGKKARLYSIWEGMIQRCYNINDTRYKAYGGKGVRIIWTDYRVFKAWALVNGYKKNLTIDRINGDGNYCPGNCQWITKFKNSSKANAIYTRGEAAEIRKIANIGNFIHARIAKAYGVSKSTIARIARYELYKKESCV